MITVQELRIGNIVIDPQHYGGETQIEIDCINYTSETKQWYHSLKPIPLTEEWLLKLGFEKQENGWKKLCICNDWTYLYWERLAGLELSVNKHSVMLPHINHIHQLQNLYFALTGQELTINKI